MKRNMDDLFLILVMLMATEIHADQSNLSHAYKNCLDRINSTTEMLACSVTERKFQDNRLNQAYQKVLKALNNEQKKQLQTVQRLWIPYRDANCTFYSDNDGGTVSSLNINACLIEMTAQRAVELERFKQ